MRSFNYNAWFAVGIAVALFLIALVVRDVSSGTSMPEETVVNRFHDDENHVTCYVYADSLFCFTDGTIDVGKEMEIAVEDGRAGAAR